jgi:sugar lactone lactonase YvrE
MRLGPDGQLYVAQAFGSQISAVDVSTGAARIVSAAGGAIVAPDDLAFDSFGNLFVTEVMSARVSALRPNGAVDVIAADVPVANGITVHADRIFMSEFNPDGRIWELFADGSAPRLIASGLMMPNALCLGPDNCLYFPLVPLGEVWRVGLDGGEAERVFGGLDIPTAVKFDDRGQLFVVESGSGAITRLDIVSGVAIRCAQVDFGIDNLAFAPDGRMFVSHFTDGSIVEIDGGGQSSVVVPGSLSGPYGLCADAQDGLVVADGMSLARIGRDGRVDRPAMLLQHGFPGYVRGVAMADDGAFIITNSAGQCARYRPGEQADILIDGLDEAIGIVAGAGETFICEAGAGRVLARDAEGEIRTVAKGLDRPTGIALAADGSLLVTEASGGRLIRIAGDDIHPILSGLGEPHGVACSANGIFVIDRCDGALHLVDADKSDRIVATGLPVGDRDRKAPNILPGIKDLMPGPLLPFSDIAMLDDGSLAVGADGTGAALIVTSL